MKPEDKRRRVLFLCTGNSYRSQMAEAVINTRLGDKWEAFSAGTKPSSYVHTKALQVLAEIGIVHHGTSKHINQLTGTEFDFVITMCDSAAEECPLWLGEGKIVHHAFTDPAEASGSDDEILAIFRQVREDIARRIPDVLPDNTDDKYL